LSTITRYLRAQAEEVILIFNPETGEFEERGMVVTSAPEVPGSWTPAEENVPRPAPVSVDYAEGSYTFLYKGGEIAISPKVTKTMDPHNAVVNWMKQKGQSFLNWWGKYAKIDEVVKEEAGRRDIAVGYTVRPTSVGKYVEPGGFESREPSIEVVIKGIPSDLLVSIGRALAGEFQQDAALVTDYETGNSQMVNTAQ